MILGIISIFWGPVLNAISPRGYFAEHKETAAFFWLSVPINFSLAL